MITKRAFTFIYKQDCVLGRYQKANISKKLTVIFE